MNKTIIVSTLIFLGMTQYAFAEDRTVQETVETTRNADGSEKTVQDNRSTVIQTEERDSRLGRGGFFIEPMLTATQQDSTVRTSQLPIVTGDTKGNSKGFGAGVRIGGHASDILIVALDGRYSRVDVDDSFYSKAKADVYNVAPMIGLQTPLFGVRIMAGYVVAGENNPGAGSQNIDLKFKEASGWRVGAGVHIYAISINLEYEDLTYNTTEVESFGSVAVNNSTSVDSNSRGYTLSLGFPIAL